MVNASDTSGGTLSYTADWGDRINNGTMSGGYPVAYQRSTFTHSYANSGTFTARFTVTNANGKSASASLSVNVGGIISASSITVLSPNGGETLYRGNNFQINWRNNDYTNGCPVGVNCTTTAFYGYYDIYLNYYRIPCTGICPIAVMAPSVIAKGVYGSSYDWQVGNIIVNGVISTALINHQYPAPYTISVCRAGTSICDTSDNPFSIQ